MMIAKHSVTEITMAVKGALLASAALVLLVAPLRAVEGPQAWLGRIFDPATLQLEVFPGAQLNRKLSVDAIQLERGGTKRIAIYIMPLDQVKAAAEFMAKQLGVSATVIGADSQYETHIFDLTGAKAPAKLKGLRVQVSRSQFVDKKGQITFEYQPPAP